MADDFSYGSGSSSSSIDNEQVSEILTSYGETSYSLEITDINKTNLSKDSKLEEILNAPINRSISGYLDTIL